MRDEIDHMVEDIKRALRAVEEVHNHGQTLKEEPSEESVRKYREALRTLQEELGSLEYIFSHQAETLYEDIADLLAEILEGEPAPYRHSPPPEEIPTYEEPQDKKEE